MWLNYKCINSGEKSMWMLRNASLIEQYEIKNNDFFFFAITDGNRFVLMKASMFIQACSTFQKLLNTTVKSVYKFVQMKTKDCWNGST